MVGDGGGLEMACATQEIASHAEQTAKAAQDSATSTNSGHALVVDTKGSINNLANEVNAKRAT
ncbi:hypothetical protein O9992_17455 [Vibrio lentus]|nr:hypothetical protein [Vibrio lentus]